MHSGKVPGSVETLRPGRAARRMWVAMLVALLVAGTFAVPLAVRAATPTTTTLDVPSGTQYGSFTVTAHVTPAPQEVGGFIPAVVFVVDGTSTFPAPIDPNGDASTPLQLAVGSHTIVARFAAFHDWDASESAPATVVVGTPTSITLTSSRNPAIATQSITVTATLDRIVSGGTLTIVDAFDSTTLASADVGPGTSSVSFTGRLPIGDHQLAARYSGHRDFGPSEAQLHQVITADAAVDASARVQYTTFYPYRDGYRDTNVISGVLREPASVLIRIYAPSGALFRTVNLGKRPVGAYRYTWSGKSASGALLRVGTYRVVQRITDEAMNVRTVSTRVVLSAKRLRWTTTSITLTGSRYWGAADPGNGYVSTARSAYARGVRLYSGRAGVAVAYRFTLRSATRYGSTVTFKVLGRSPNGTRVVEGLWNRASCPPAYVGCYDTKSMGPSYRWWSISGSSGLHVEGRTAYGLVAVPYSGGPRSFDIARVRLVYRYAVLR